MLCAVCMSIFQSSELSGDHHQNSRDVRTAASNGCRICQEVGKLFPPEYPDRLPYRLNKHRAWVNNDFIELRILWKSVFIHVSRVPVASIPHGYHDFLDSVKADLKSDPCIVRRGCLKERPMASNTGDVSVAALAKGWLDGCKRGHKCEQMLQARRLPGWFPSRLVQVGDCQGPPRLVTREKHLIEGTYASLSHCWGENPKFLTLTTSNLEELCQEIPLTSLPASFRDAILTCQRLGIPYLWIDSLCILQSGPGSESDWLFHVSGEMSRIYSFCELNIAIDVAASPEEGAFRLRDPTYLQDCYVWTPHTHFRSSGTPSSSLLADSPNTSTPFSDMKHPERHPDDQGSHSPSAPDSCLPPSPTPTVNLYTILTQGDLNEDLWYLPLGRRAWAFQELLLSPRTLHFQSDRISWQCEERGHLSEYLHHDPNGPSSRARFGTKSGSKLYFQIQYNLEESEILDEEVAGSRDSFYQRVFQYTSRQLSHPDKDKLVAFSAVARHYARLLGEEYHAGVFGGTMPIGLMWNAGRVPPAVRTRGYRAPSWSWASQNGAVYFHVISELEGWYWGDLRAAGGGVDRLTLLATVEVVKVELVDETNRFGQVKAASLTMKGPVLCWRDVIARCGERDGKRVTAHRIDSEEYDAFVRTGEGAKIKIIADEPGPWSGNNRVPWGKKPQRVFMMVVASIKLREAEMQREENKRVQDPDYTNFAARSAGLFLRPLDDGTFVRLGIWKADMDITERYKAVEGVLTERTVVIV